MADWWDLFLHLVVIFSAIVGALAAIALGLLLMWGVGYALLCGISNIMFWWEERGKD